jgi:hypothetical protein
MFPFDQRVVPRFLALSFGVNRIRVHDLWHFQHRLIRKTLVHTLRVLLHLQSCQVFPEPQTSHQPL